MIWGTVIWGVTGGEIPTPNIDKIATWGVKFTHFYTIARSCPSRASLLTGLYPHQAGIGGMSEDGLGPYNKDSFRHDWGTKGYRGYLNRNSVTIAEVLKKSGLFYLYGW